MADGSVPITAGSGTNIRAITNAGVQSGAYQQVMSIAGPDGTLIPYDPDGTLQVAHDSSALLFDAFDGTLGNWTTGGTAPTISGGNVNFASTTTASGSSFMRTNLTFALRPQAYLRAGSFVQVEAATIANNTRWWGYGQNQTTPSAASPVLNGAVFMLDYSAGTFMAAVYSAGSRTQSVNLTHPDANLHKYEIWFRQAIVYFLVDGVTVATISTPNTAVTSGMYLISGSTNHTTAPGTAPILRLSSMSMADTSGTVGTIGDGVNPTTQVTVKNASTAVAATDFPMAVGLHPTSPLPSGANTIGTVNANPVLPAGAFVTLAATTNATLFKGSAGAVTK